MNCLTCFSVSDPDAVDACVNFTVSRFKKRSKNIRHKQNFSGANCIRDFKPLQLSVSYGISDPENKSNFLSDVIKASYSQGCAIETYQNHETSSKSVIGTRDN